MSLRDKESKQKLEQLQLEAEAAYQEFLKRLKKLEDQRSDIVKETLKQMDQDKIEDIRKKLGLSV